MPDKRRFSRPAAIAHLGINEMFIVVLLQYYTQVKYQDDVVLLLMSQCTNQNSQQVPWCDIEISTSSH